MIRSMYKTLCSCVKTSEGLTEFFPCKIGTRQGCMLSPFLFVLYFILFIIILSPFLFVLYFTLFIIDITAEFNNGIFVRYQKLLVKFNYFCMRII